MIKIVAADAMVSPGYQGAPSIWTSDNGNASQFRIGCRVFDPKAEKNSRWVNIQVKAFGKLSEKVGKMGLKEKSVVNISGRLDEDIWTADNVEHRRFVIVADEIEFAYGNNKEQATSCGPVPDAHTGGQSGSAPQNGQYAAPGAASAASSAPAPAPGAAPAVPAPAPGGQGFTGYEQFGGENPFFGG